MRPLRVLGAVLLAALAFQAQAVGRVADVTIFDRSTGRELPVYWHDGRAYVVGRPGNEYSVGLRNRRGEDVLAVVSVDGVNVMNGETKLVGVEFIVDSATWLANHNNVPPVLEGQVFNLVGGPNRYNLPPFFELHVWAWRHNPNGAFVDWNDHVTCAGQ